MYATVVEDVTAKVASEENVEDATSTLLEEPLSEAGSVVTIPLAVVKTVVCMVLYSVLELVTALPLELSDQR